MNKYRIGKLTFTQTELTWGQDRALMALFNRLRAQAAPDDDFQMNTAFELFAKYDLLAVALGIILKPVWNARYILYVMGQVIRFPFTRRFYWVPANKLDHSQIRQIKKDFFFTNKELINELRSLLNGLGLIATAAMEPEMTNSTNSSPAKKARKTKNSKAKSKTT